VFIEIVIELETYHIYKSVLLTIKVTARNVSGGKQLIVFPQHNIIILDIRLLLHKNI
jgi:hypothetical protein